MFNIPLQFILVDPKVDIVVFILVVYLFVFRIYKNMIDIDIKGIFWFDIKLTIIFLLLGYLNYGNQNLNLNFININLFSYIILIQLLIETLYVIIFKKDVKKYLNKLRNKVKKDRIDKIKKEIDSLNEIRNIIEVELENAKINNNEKEILKISKDLKIIRGDIDFLENELNR